MRIMLDIRRTPQRAKYVDSINAALVAGLVALGTKSKDVVGMSAKPWTFGVEGRTDRKGATLIMSVTVSTPDAELGAALARLDPDAIRCSSSNGDVLYFGAARHEIIDTANAKTEELMVAFASPFIIPLQKSDPSKKAYSDDLSEVDLDAALRTGLERRAGRDLEVSFHVDPLSRMTDVKKRVIPLRKSPRGTIHVPAFAVPMTLRGTPEDVEFAFLAGLGAKTRAGFGCPIFMK